MVKSVALAIFSFVQAMVYAIGITIWAWIAIIVVAANATVGVVGVSAVASWAVPESAHPAAYAVIWVILMLAVGIATFVTLFSFVFAGKLKWQD